MLMRSVKFQLLAFVVVTLLGVTYVGANYVGLFQGLLGNHACTIYADFPEAGGAFSGSEVTYRGVTVGKVSQLHITPTGVRADLRLTNCASPKIPANASAVVSDRSVIGEQYVNLIPSKGGAPYLAAGAVIPQSRNSVPIPAETFLSDLDSLINSVDIPALRTTVSELEAAFQNQAPAFGQLLTSANALLTAAQQNLPATLSLLKNSGTVLDTQLAEKGSLASFSTNLQLLAQQLKSSDPDIRRLLDESPTDLNVLKQFIQNNSTDLGVLLADSANLGDLLVEREGDIRQVLILYPLLPGGAMSAIGADGVAATGLVPNDNDPPDCGAPNGGTEGYDGTPIRSPSDTSSTAPNTGAHCDEPASSGIGVRGSQNVPGGDPISTPNSSVSDSAIEVGPSFDNASVLGDKSWEAILTASLN